MFVVCAVVSIVLAVMLLASAGGMLAKAEPIVTSLTGVGVPPTWFPRLASLKILGAVGLIVGLFLPAIGIAAAIGVICYFVGALYVHLRAGDRAVAPPLVYLALAVVALLTRIASM